MDRRQKTAIAAGEIDKIHRKIMAATYASSGDDVLLGHCKELILAVMHAPSTPAWMWSKLGGVMQCLKDRGRPE